LPEKKRANFPTRMSHPTILTLLAESGFYLFACKHAEKSELNRTEEEPSEAQHQGQRTRRTKAAEHALDPFRGCMAVCGSGNGNGSGRASAQGLNCT